MNTMSCPRVLIADDDPWTRETLEFLLRDEGYETLEATNGVEALDLLLLSPSPLLVLLDLLMPIMTGFEVLNHIAQDEKLATRHRYIALSASPFRMAERIGPNFSALLQRLDVAFIEKPFEIDELLRLVRISYTALVYATKPDQPPPDSGGEQTA